MSLQFSDTSNFKGLVQIYEKEIGVSQGDVSGSTTKLKSFAADANLAFDRFLALAFASEGTWQFDDTNHTDFPEITATLTSGTRRYSLTNFTADAGSNLNLEVYKVFVKNPSGIYVELEPRDVQSQDDTTSFTDGAGATGTPTRYDKTGKWIDLDPVPNYTVAAGIKCLINREASYFVSTDTTKKPGVPGIFHEYFALWPAAQYARRGLLSNANALQERVFLMEQEITAFFGKRNKDERPRMSPARDSNK